MDAGTPQLQMVPVNAVEIRSNTRKRIGSLDELAKSIEQHGVLTPIRVRKSEAGFELIFGQRRLLAARKAGLKEVPAVVATVSDEQLVEEQLIENGQRADIHPMEVMHTRLLGTRLYHPSQGGVAWSEPSSE